MSIYYLDASAWVKRYVQEPGSAWMHNLFANEHRLAAATLGYIETTAALSRRLSGSEQTRALSQLDLDC